MFIIIFDTADTNIKYKLAYYDYETLGKELFPYKVDPISERGNNSFVRVIAIKSVSVPLKFVQWCHCTCWEK